VSALLASHEVMFLDVFLESFFIFLYFIYKLVYHPETMKICFKNYQKLTHKHIGCLVGVALISIISGIALYELEKNYNTPLVNSLLIRSGSFVVLFIIGVLIFKEVYNWKQIVGIIMTMVGIGIITVYE